MKWWQWLIISVIIGLVAIPVVMLTWIGVYVYRHPCVKSHREMVHHSAWTQMIFTGKVMIPIFHPAYDSMDEICDERKGE